MARPRKSPRLEASIESNDPDRSRNDFLDQLAKLLARKWFAMSPGERATASGDAPQSRGC